MLERKENRRKRKLRLSRSKKEKKTSQYQVFVGIYDVRLDAQKPIKVKGVEVIPVDGVPKVSRIPGTVKVKDNYYVGASKTKNRFDESAKIIEAIASQQGTLSTRKQVDPDTVSVELQDGTTLTAKRSGKDGIIEVKRPGEKIVAIRLISAPQTGSYKDMTKSLKGKNLQANHLNQNAAYKSVIPENDGLANGMRGNAFTDRGTPHYKFHQSLEQFWGQYRMPFG